ncbi:MAG: sulfite exporter TauE/SafE family protein [Victivallales bacterium]|nr:sulfite exporter TauE/SafE family protein [Victivallales bacterium]
MDPEIYNLDVAGWVLAKFCALVIGMSKAGITGLASMAVPLMTMAVPARASTGVMLPLLIFGDFLGVAYFRRSVNGKILMKLMPTALVGIVLGYLLMRQPWMDDSAIRKTIGIIVLFLTALSFARGRWQVSFGEKEASNARTIVIAGIFGIVAGMTTMIANAAGPVMMIYLLAMKLPKNEFIATSAWYFAVLNLCKVPFMVNLGMINKESLLFDARLVPALLLGAFLGIVFSSQISEKQYKYFIQALTVIAALKLLF